MRWAAIESELTADDKHFEHLFSLCPDMNMQMSIIELDSQAQK